jgi:hypothetical protein
MPNTFDYPLSDRTNPEGANDLSALALFYQRSLYKETVYPSEFPAPIDTWHDKTLYGKIDRRQNTILLKNEKISPVLSVQKERIYAADFVVEAFEGFAEHMSRAHFNGRLNDTTDGNLYTINAAQGWVCPHKTYSKYVENLYEGFMRYHVRRHHDQIDNFNSFTVVMKEFLRSSATIFPVTMTNALLTTMVDPFMSGLSIKIANFDAGDDKIKYQKFISNPNFDFYRSAAKKFGFIVDKNKPWILTADLFSDAMVSFIPHFKTADGVSIEGSTTKESFFIDYYHRACLGDIKNFKEMFVNFYNRYIGVHPYYEKKTSGGPRCSYKTNVALIPREPTTLVELNNLMTDFDWIDYYIELREIESGGTRLKRGFMKRVAREKYEISRLHAVNTTSMDALHKHQYQVDPITGNGLAYINCHPDFPGVCHSHEIKNGVVLESQSKSIDPTNGAPVHTHWYETPLDSAILYVNSVYRQYLYPPSYLINLLRTLTPDDESATMGTGGVSAAGSVGTSY